VSETTLADLIARRDPNVMLGPDWSEQRWPVSSNARGLSTLDKNGEVIGMSWWVPFGEGWEIPAGFEYTGGGPFDWALWIQVVEGKAECLAAKCWSPEGHPITAESYRRLPLGRLMEDGVLCASRPWGEIPKRHVLWESPAEARRQRATVAETYRSTRRSPRERTPITDELLREVARIYREELAGGAPTKAVAERLNYSRASAGRLVMEARRPERGFLPPTEMRRARG
jgi:hypothetical protein